MKNKIVSIITTVLLVSLAMACKDKKTVDTENKKTEEQAGWKVAVLDIDSMQSALDYYKTKTGEFNKEGEAIQNELIGIQRSIQNTAANLQQRIGNKDISDVEIANTNKRLESMQINLQKKQESLSMALMQKQQEFSMTLTAMMEAFTKEYNNEAKYDLILIKSAATFSRPEMDITADFTPKFNEWINKKLTDEVMMKTFSDMGRKKAEEQEKADTVKK